MPVATVQPLPARGAPPRAGQDLAQHGLLPARVRRADPAHQAAPGGALHAAAGDPRAARARGRRARAPAGDDRARGPDPRAGAGRASASAIPAEEVRERYDDAQGGPRPPRRARRAHAPTRAATPRRTCGSSRRSAASAPAATTSGSASPSTTRCATSRRWSRWSREEVEVLMERLAGELDARARGRADRGRRRAAQGPDRRAAHEAAGRRAGAPPGAPAAEATARRAATEVRPSAERKAQVDNAQLAEDASAVRGAVALQSAVRGLRPAGLPALAARISARELRAVGGIGRRRRRSAPRPRRGRAPRARCAARSGWGREIAPSSICLHLARSGLGAEARPQLDALRLAKRHHGQVEHHRVRAP